MAVALVVVTKEYAGEEWCNTYGITTSTSGTEGFPSDSEITAAIGNGPLTAANTDPSNGTYADFVTILRAIVAFERLIHRAVVVFKSIYMGDGRHKESGIDSENAFYVQSLGFNALGDGTPAAQIAPGGVVLQVNRNPVGFSQRQGRAFYRGVLSDADVSFDGPRLNGFTDDTQRGYWVDIVADSQDEALLPQFYVGAEGGPPPWYLGIPNYATPLTIQSGYELGDLQRVTPISGLVMRGVTLRQVKKGRKRPSGAPGA